MNKEKLIAYDEYERQLATSLARQIQEYELHIKNLTEEISHLNAELRIKGYHDFMNQCSFAIESRKTALNRLTCCLENLKNKYHSLIPLKIPK